MSGYKNGIHSWHSCFIVASHHVTKLFSHCILPRRSQLGVRVICQFGVFGDDLARFGIDNGHTKFGNVDGRGVAW